MRITERQFREWVEIMSQVTDAITALTAAVDNLAANGEASSTDAADAAAIGVQTARVVALTAPAGTVSVTGTFPSTVGPTLPGEVPQIVTPSLSGLIASTPQYPAS
jgi:hypothetical protein